MSKIIFLKPYCKDVVWGGTKIKKLYDYDTKTDTTGEAWVVSANENGESIGINDEFKDKPLSQIFNEYKSQFGTDKDEFPVLLKYIDARDDLSIQVHPDDQYARAVEKKTYGKTECWYILDCEPNSTIIVGHNAKDSDELKQMVDNKNWNELLREFPIKKGDFFYIPSGTVHAIKKGTLVFEIQQNSDITYRFYDYDRLQNGKLRELHIQKSLDVAICPHEDINTRKYVDENIEILVECENFVVERHDIKNKIELKNKDKFQIFNVLNGSGTINGISISKGDNFITLANYGNIEIKGQIEYILTYEPEK